MHKYIYIYIFKKFLKKIKKKKKKKKKKKPFYLAIFKVIVDYKLYWCTTPTLQTLLGVDYKFIFNLNYVAAKLNQT